jgi:hypothetical protein
MNTLEVEKQSRRIVRTLRAISADSSGALPTRFQLLRVGLWDTPNHGVFIIGPDDLLEYKTNFDAGIAQVVGENGNAPDGIMIDYDHESEVAGGWIKGMKVEGDTLWADPVVWSSQGTADLEGKNYKYISPEFYPKSRGGWPDPEQYDVYIPNVIAAASLVNRPLFKGLDPIMAKADGGGSRNSEDVIYINASEEGNRMPTLAEVIAKDGAAGLTEEEKKVLVDNQATLTAEQKVKFGLEAAPVAPAPVVSENKEEPIVPVVDPELAQIAASVKNGDNVVIKASVYKDLVDSTEQYQTEKAETIVDGHVARGAIKADSKAFWVSQLVGVRANADARKNLEEQLAALNDNPVMASEVGSSTRASDATSAQDQLMTKAQEAVKASISNGVATVTLSDAMKGILASDRGLAEQVKTERAAAHK